MLYESFALSLSDAIDSPVFGEKKTTTSLSVSGQDDIGQFTTVANRFQPRTTRPTRPTRRPTPRRNPRKLMLPITDVRSSQPSHTP